MRNWVKRKKSYWSLARINASRIVLNASQKIKDPKPRLIKNLKKYSTRQSLKSQPEIHCPPDLKIELEKIYFSDLFFSEEFSSLRQGLKEIYNQHSAFVPDQNSERIDLWFNSIQNSESNSSSIYLGWLVFKEDNAIFFDKAQISLCYVEPSFISLSISIEPSSIFKDKFNKLIRRIPLAQHEITSINFRKSFVSVKTYSPFFTQKIDLEKLFLDFNKNLVILFRAFFKSGLSVFGPLPSIEILSINSSLQEIPRIPSPRMPKSMMSCRYFLQSIGYPFQGQAIYKYEDFLEFYEITRNELFYPASSTYQMLVSKAGLEKLEDSSIEMMFGSPIFHELFFAFSIEHFYKTLKNLIVNLKSELDPALSGQLKGERFVERFKLNISKMVVLNAFQFHHSRLWTGIDDFYLWEYIGFQTKLFVASDNKRNDPENLLMFLKTRTDADKLFCSEQLSFLRSSYDNLLTYKVMSLNFWFQNITLWLSLAVALLTILTIFPEDSREVFLNKIWSYIQLTFFSKNS